MKKAYKEPINLSEINQALFERSIEGLLVMNKSKIIRLSNPAASNILGYSLNGLYNKKLDDIVPEEFREDCHQLWDIFFSPENNNASIKTVVTFLKKDKSKVVAEVSMSNHIHAKEGSLMIVLFSDITDRFKMENNMKKEKELYENVLEKTEDAFLSLDENWRFTHVNKVCLSLMGKKTKEEIVGEIIWELFPELKGTTLETLYREVMKTRKQASLESLSLYRDCWYDIRVSPHDKGIAVFSWDITEEKKRTDELKKSEERFAKAFRSGPVALAITRFGDGQYKDVNDNFLNLFEYKYEEVVGKTANELGIYRHCKPGERERFIGLLTTNGSVKNMEITFSKSSGVPVSMLISSEIISLNGEDHILTTMIDISDKKQAEESMIRLNEFLENTVRERTERLTKALEREKENNDLKSRFVTMASHEFRTPLAVLMTSVSILEEYTESKKNEKIAKHFNRIKSSVANLTAILNDFLSLEKIERGETNTESTTFNLREMIENITAEMKGSLKNGQIINYEHKGDSEIVHQDKKILYNTFMNLISNASKYSDEESPVDIYSEISNGKVKIDIKDYGIGIPEEEQHNMFTLFFRAKNADAIQGTGLGLNIVKKYMEMIGGDISFLSKENEGSVFTIIFPKNIKK
ncbi:MAG: PAS domain S-box protein [Bacteroidia bacterium]